MAFSDMRTAVLLVAPNQISNDSTSPSYVGHIINQAYGKIARLRQWVDTQRDAVMSVSAPYATGTVTLTNGSTALVGVGTAFTAGMVGRYLYVDNNPVYRIAAYVSATQVTLATAWVGAGAANTAYQIRESRIVMPSDCDRVLRVRIPQTNFVLSGEAALMVDAGDSARNITGTPLVWLDMGVGDNTSGLQELELWPSPDTSYGLQVTYRRKLPALLADTDKPVFPEELITTLAQADACKVLASRTGEAVWLQLSQSYEAHHALLLDSYQRSDRRRRNSSQQLLEREDIPNGLDVSWVAAFRQLQASLAMRIG